MPTSSLLYALVQLSACDDIDDLIDDAFALLERELRVRGSIELWHSDDTRFTRGDIARGGAVHRTWIGIRYTLGAIYLTAQPPAHVREDIELVAQQLAPLAERLLDRDASHRRTIREDIQLLYERRIRDALIRSDWNASAVARELRVGRGRVAEIAHRWRSRSEHVFRTRASAVIANHNAEDNVQLKNDSILRTSPRSL